MVPPVTIPLGQFVYRTQGPDFSELTFAPTWAALMQMLPLELSSAEDQYTACERDAHDACAWGDCLIAARRRVGELAALPEGTPFQVRFARTFVTYPAG